MKTFQLKLSSTLFVLIYFLIFTTEAKKADVEKTKQISKNYSVNSEHVMNIENKFGEVKITTWEKNEVSVNITIKVDAKNDEKAQEFLDDIVVEIEEGKSNSSYRTMIGSKKGKIKINNNESKGFEVNYDVKMPRTNNLNLKNEFGPFIINDLDGKADIEVKFGSANIGKLTHAENKLAFEFSDQVLIQHLDKGHLTVKFSKCELGAATDIKVASEFSDIEIDGVGNLVLALKFGSVNIDQVIDAEIASNMSKINIDYLKGKGVFKPKYGKLNIDKVSKEMTGLDINGEFTPIDVTIEEGASFEADFYVSMSGINVPNVKWTTKDTEGNSKSYKGIIGGSSKNKVSIHSSFGKVNVDF